MGCRSTTTASAVRSVRAATGRVFVTFVDLDGCPGRWPGIRCVTRVDDDTAEVVCRSVLPCALTPRPHRAAEGAT